MRRLLFGVAEIFQLSSRPGTVIVAADCPERAAPTIRIGQWLEFRNPTGDVTRAIFSGIEFLDPLDPDRLFAFSVRPDPPHAPVEKGAEVWTTAENET